MFTLNLLVSKGLRRNNINNVFVEAPWWSNDDEMVFMCYRVDSHFLLFRWLQEHPRTMLKGFSVHYWWLGTKTKFDYTEDGKEEQRDAEYVLWWSSSRKWAKVIVKWNMWRVTRFPLMLALNAIKYLETKWTIFHGSKIHWSVKVKPGSRIAYVF